MKVALAVVISMTLATPLAAQDRTGSNESVHASATDPVKNDAVTKDAAPEHAHTGWATLLKDTGRDFLAFPVVAPATGESRTNRFSAIGDDDRVHTRAG